MKRHYRYAWIGGLLAAGAPAGLLGLRLAGERRAGKERPFRRVCEELLADSLTYAYVGVSTAAVFVLFGYVLGRQAERLAQLSETDALTGLANARGLLARLDVELARSRRERTPLALLLVDLDGLKRLNDEYGHQAGDQAIRDLADVIRSELRATDVGARWGGDEFAVLAPGTSHDDAWALAERIRRSIPYGSTAWQVSASFGVAAIEPERCGRDMDPATLMRLADMALYQAKRSGKDRVATISAVAPDLPAGDANPPESRPETRRRR